MALNRNAKKLRFKPIVFFKDSFYFLQKINNFYIGSIIILISVFVQMQALHPLVDIMQNESDQFYQFYQQAVAGALRLKR